MKLLEKPGLLVLDREEFEACRPHLRAAGYRWLKAWDGVVDTWGRQWWSPTSNRWVSDMVIEGRHGLYYLELECLPHILTVSNAADFARCVGRQTP